MGLGLLVKGGTEQGATLGAEATSFQPLTSHLSGLLVGCLNARSVNRKSATITDIIASSNLDVLAIQETWHENSESLTLHRAIPPGYSVVEKAREAKVTINLRARVSTGGGVAIIYRSEFKCKKLLTSSSYKTFEYVCCRLTASGSGSDVVIVSLYRPGSKPLTAEFFSDFTSLLEALATFRCKLVLMGDVNIHLERTDDVRVCAFTDLLSSFDLYQYVGQSTHSAGGLLDVVIARRSDSIRDIKVTEIGVSDHTLITGRLIMMVSSSESIPIVGRKWGAFSLDEFRSDLINSVICNGITEWSESLSIDELFDVYNSELTKILDKHAPCYVRKRKRRSLTPWFDADCRQMKRKVRCAERRYRKSHEPSDRLAWVTKLQEQSQLYRDKEQFYWTAGINTNAGNPKSLWRDLDELMKRDEGDKNRQYTPDEATKQANDFLQFFERKVENVRSETQHAAEPLFTPTTGEKFTCFRPTTPIQIVHMINASKNKHCSLDPIPTDIVKKCADLLAPFISMIFNRSLQEGYLSTTV